MEKGNTDYRVNPEEPNLVMPEPAQAKKGNGMLVGGLILIFLGLFFLLNEFDLIPYWFNLGKLWPLAIIIPGLVMLINARDRANAAVKKEEQEKGAETDSESIH